MTETPETAPPKPRRPWRLVSGFALALTIAFSAYVVMSATSAGARLFASLWFLALLPAVLSALICHIGDPDGARSSTFYWTVPMVLVGLVIAGSVLVLGEGVICLLMLSPVWIAFGWAGAFAYRSQRGRSRATLQSSFLIIPLVVGVVEARVPVPHDAVAVTRTILIEARPDQVWPFAVSNRSIDPREGRWTITQNLIGLPRPRATMMHGAGVGAVRNAFWGDHISFDEIITDWAPGHKLGWRFRFTNTSLQDYTDQHISPDGEFLKIDSGDYTMKPAPGGRTELTLTTRYVAKTHANPYAELWGELLLGDTEDNILSVIKGRAEAAARGHNRGRG